jgi:CPA1 family monovalent cation:H+ antiporter
MSLNFSEGLLLLLLTAALVALLTRRLFLPYSVGLALAGMALGALTLSPQITLTRQLIFSVLLPPLIFQTSLNLRWSQLRRELPVILTLAGPGVAISATLVAAGMRYAAQWGWPASIVFGALIAATDPVAVLETFREAGVHGRLRLLTEAESLLNDGTAAVAFAVAVAWAEGRTVSGFSVAVTLAATIGGSILCGAVAAGVILFLVGHTEDHLVELSFTAVAAYGSFLFSEQLHFSGVLATIVAGVIIGNYGPVATLSDRGREAIEAFWEYAAFVANSLVFLLIGVRETKQHFSGLVIACVVAVAVVALGRAAAVYPLCALFARTPLRVTARHQFALFWGGLRGALALALALGLPLDFAGREEIVTVSFAVVAFSIFVQGLTMPIVLRRIGELPARRGAG